MVSYDLSTPACEDWIWQTVQRSPPNWFQWAQMQIQQCTVECNKELNIHVAMLMVTTALCSIQAQVIITLACQHYFTPLSHPLTQSKALW